MENRSSSSSSLIHPVPNPQADVKVSNCVRIVFLLSYFLGSKICLGFCWYAFLFGKHMCWFCYYSVYGLLIVWTILEWSNCVRECCVFRSIGKPLRSLIEKIIPISELAPNATWFVGLMVYGLSDILTTIGTPQLILSITPFVLSIISFISLSYVTDNHGIFEGSCVGFGKLCFICAYQREWRSAGLCLVIMVYSLIAKKVDMCSRNNTLSPTWENPPLTINFCKYCCLGFKRVKVWYEGKKAAGKRLVV